MFLVLLRFSNGKGKARELLPGHNEWLKRGFDDGVFLIAGSLEAGMGGAVLADARTRAELEERVRGDPFVVHDVVTAEILEISPSKTDPRLAFLIA
jgi:uncharacterized protein YciI